MSQRNKGKASRGRCSRWEESQSDSDSEWEPWMEKNTKTTKKTSEFTLTDR